MKINIFPHILLTFWPDFFFIFMGIIQAQKILICTLFFWQALGGEGVSESVWFVLMKMLTFMDGRPPYSFIFYFKLYFIVSVYIISSLFFFFFF